MPNRVCIQPCLGLETPLSTVGRQATYAAHVILGDDIADVGCAPALYADVQEDIDFILDDWVIAVESCDRLCANHLVADKGGQVHQTVRVDDVVVAAGIAPDELPREHLPLDHPAVIAVADEIVRVARELLGSGDL